MRKIQFWPLVTSPEGMSPEGMSPEDYSPFTIYHLYSTISYLLYSLCFILYALHFPFNIFLSFNIHHSSFTINLTP